MNRALAIAAHPDDIEFVMAGTLLLLKQAGWEIHYLNLSTGNCGSMEHSPAATRRIRRNEAVASASILGAFWHPPFCDDLEILYAVPLLRRLAAVVRQVRPSIVLTHSPQDYMEDHSNTCRLAVTAAFSRGMPNFKTTPSRRAVDVDVTVYHALPHGLCDPLGKPVIPTHLVDTTRVQTQKRRALAAHTSQKSWLDKTQGMGSYLDAMDQMSREVGNLSRRFEFAEGWRKHLHLGFCDGQADPLREQLGKDCLVNRGR